MYRVLNEAKPKCILEFGLGQTTRMISQYAAAHPDVTHIVVEQDLDWINFFKNNFTVGSNTEILHLPITYINFLGDEGVSVYENLFDKIKNNKFDFISIDAPGPNKAQDYARIDILSLIPQNLAKRFCILKDDVNLPKCNRTLTLVKEKFMESNIDIESKVYAGDKKFALLCSPDQKFLCSL